MTGQSYYNENDPYAAQWLRNLIDAGHIPAGHVDERSIEDVQAEDLSGFTQCHFFAGIGGWPYALRLAGWSYDRPVWTGSCPCQPLSGAGQRKGHADKRHLWPAFQSLISECRPATIFGEQVASKDGREWFSAVRADLEECGYACGCADLAAASVGAPHIRQRLFWVGHSSSSREQGINQHRNRAKESQSGKNQSQRPSEDVRMADSSNSKRWPLNEYREDGLDGSHGRRSEAHGEPGARGEVRGVADAGRGSVRSRSGSRNAPQTSEETESQEDQRKHQEAAGEQGKCIDMESGGFWRDIELIPCADGKTRVTQPGLRPLAHGIHNRVGRLRAYGNAIVPQAAAQFIHSFNDAVK